MSINPIDVFICFDPEHDRDLYELLLDQSRASGSTFTVSGASRPLVPGDFLGEGARTEIRAADQMIVLCGQHTEESTGVSGELRVAREERTPHFLVWGRRDIMCTKPLGAEPADAMYGWTDDIIHDRIQFLVRQAAATDASEA